MSRLAAVIVDTYASQLLPRLAIERTVATGLVERVYTFSTSPIYPGEEFHRINPIRSAADYSHFMLNVVPHFVDADALLVIQWDGMPCNAAAWSEDFFAYDYIGAPWHEEDDGCAVGNGGFSLRSRRLMQTLAKIKPHCPLELPDGDAEDAVICRYKRFEFDQAGCRFSPVEVARRFAVENIPSPFHFGFHGVFNFPDFLPEEVLIDCGTELCERTGRDLFLVNFLIACLRNHYDCLYREVVASLQKSGRVERLRSVLQGAGRTLPLFS